MSKDINNYLHLYLGCDCMWAIIVPGQEPTFEKCQLKIRELHGVLNNLALCKPILRHLSSMTEEEAAQVNVVGSAGWRLINPDPEVPTNITLGVVHRQSAEVAYLLSKGFDLFGLIDKGLAIDESTIKTND